MIRVYNSDKETDQEKKSEVDSRTERLLVSKKRRKAGSGGMGEKDNLNFGGGKDNGSAEERWNIDSRGLSSLGNDKGGRQKGKKPSGLRKEGLYLGDHRKYGK